MKKFGPWFVGAQNDALYIIDRNPASSNDYPNHEADCEAIAKVYDNVRGVSAADHAALIAAAPEMLSVIRALVDDLVCMLPSVRDDLGWQVHNEEGTLKRAKSIITKATGESE